MRYVLGVDGGQTSTLAVVASEDGALLAAGRGGPANHLNEPGGRERLRRSLADSIGEALARAELAGQAIAAACLGITGSGALVPELLPAIVSVEWLRVENDAVTALAGATTCQPGVIVIAGTGSVAFGINAAGDRVAVGGWGYLMGDEGSGYDVALRALRAATRAADGRGPATRLVVDIPAHFGQPDLRALHRRIYSGELERPRIAEIASVVGDAANAGDEQSRAILATAAWELAEAATAVLRRLDCLGVEMPVAPVGGVFRAGEPILEPLARHLRELAPRARVQSPEYPPVVGAVMLALRGLGLPLDEARLAWLDATLAVATASKQA